MKYDDPSATAGQFLLFLFIVIQALSELFSVWRYAGFKGFHQEVDRRKHCVAASVVLKIPHLDLISSEFSFMRFYRLK